MDFKILPQQAFKNLRCRTILTFRKHPQAIDEIGDYMKGEANHDETNYFVFYKNRAQKINGDKVF